MKVVNRATFLAMPEGTVFAKFGNQPKETRSYDLSHRELAIKGETVRGIDFVVQDLVPWFQDCEDSNQWADAMIRMIEGEESPPLDYESDCRDGLFDNDQLFMVFNRDDLAGLIARLQRALEEGYPPAIEQP